jgi:hypothetical protein
VLNLELNITAGYIAPRLVALQPGLEDAITQHAPPLIRMNTVRVQEQELLPKLNVPSVVTHMNVTTIA